MLGFQVLVGRLFRDAPVVLVFGAGCHGCLLDPAGLLSGLLMIRSTLQKSAEHVGLLPPARPLSPSARIVSVAILVIISGFGQSCIGNFLV